MISFLKKYFLLGVIFLIILFVGVWLLISQSPKTSSLSGLPDHSIIDWQLENQPLKVELVNTPASITQGLSGRESLDVDGMLFVFDESVIRTFWMKDMRFAIDIIWLNDGKVIGVENDVQPPEPGTPDSQLERRTSPGPVDMVLETLPSRLAGD
jgi:hypothetical protein